MGYPATRGREQQAIDSFGGIGLNVGNTGHKEYERCASPEKENAGADPREVWGRQKTMKVYERTSFIYHAEEWRWRARILRFDYLLSSEIVSITSVKGRFSGFSCFP